jgi:putative spermidine/putrescine transport system ATP-binding protein
MTSRDNETPKPIDDPIDDPIVEFRGVYKTYDGETLVIRNLNFEVRRGEFLTLLGPSGSGKTTTLMMLAGFETPTEGDIRLEGRTITNVPPYERGIGMVFQNYALFPHMTVWENVAFPLQARSTGRADIETKVAHALDMVQLQGFERRRPAQLSGGQQQRVSLARALVFDPAIVLMDEPLGALDKQLREHMQLEIKHLHQQVGITVVYVTHDQAEALTMSDRIVVFNDGEAQQIAPPDILYEKPDNAFVAQFVGENNRFRGVVAQVDKGACRVSLEGGHEVLATPVKVSRAGDRTTLSIRPERVEIDPPPHSLPNVFQAKVEELIYLGDCVRVRLTVCGNPDFVVKISNIFDHKKLSPGGMTRVGWRAEDCRALDHK